LEFIILHAIQKSKIKFIAIHIRDNNILGVIETIPNILTANPLIGKNEAMLLRDSGRLTNCIFAWQAQYGRGILLIIVILRSSLGVTSNIISGIHV
jgi:hypothetical protein